MALYKLGKSYDEEAVRVVLKQDNSNIKIWIPFDSDNKDYQDYLEWVAEGNTAEAAD